MSYFANISQYQSIISWERSRQKDLHPFGSTIFSAETMTLTASMAAASWIKASGSLTSLDSSRYTCKVRAVQEIKSDQDGAIYGDSSPNMLRCMCIAHADLHHSHHSQEPQALRFPLRTQAPAAKTSTRIHRKIALNTSLQKIFYSYFHPHYNLCRSALTFSAICSACSSDTFLIQQWGGRIRGVSMTGSSGHSCFGFSVEICQARCHPCSIFSCSTKKMMQKHFVFLYTPVWTNISSDIEFDKSAFISLDLGAQTVDPPQVASLRWKRSMSRCHPLCYRPWLPQQIAPPHRV